MFDLSSIGGYILNCEWCVRPSISKSDAIPVEATGITDLPCPCNMLISVLYKKVLPVPPGPSRKNCRQWECKSVIELINWLNASTWPSLRLKIIFIPLSLASWFLLTGSSRKVLLRTSSFDLPINRSNSIIYLRVRFFATSERDLDECSLPSSEVGMCQKDNLHSMVDN